MSLEMETAVRSEEVGTEHSQVGARSAAAPSPTQPTGPSASSAKATSSHEPTVANVQPVVERVERAGKQVLSAGVKASPARDLPDDDYGYRPISLLAPLTLFFAFCSLFGVLGLFGVLLAVVGVFVGGLCLWMIRRSEGELGGYAMALTGTIICLAMGLVGGSYQGYVYATEVPEGYERIDFNWMAQQNPIYSNGRLLLTEDLKAVNGKKVYVKGYMYPMEQRHELTEFVLCKDTGDCCFGGNPKVQDMIRVRMTDGLTVDHRELILSGVAGILRVEPSLSDKGELETLYFLDGTHFR